MASAVAATLGPETVSSQSFPFHFGRRWGRCARRSVGGAGPGYPVRQMRRTPHVATALLLASLLALSGCAGAPAPNTPVDTVRNAFRLVDEGNLDGLTAMTCEAQKAAIRQQFAGTLPGLPPGIDLGEIFSALKVDSSQMTFLVTSESGDTASVQVAGNLGISFEGEKLRDLLKGLAHQQGQPIDDARLDQLIATLNAASQAVPVNENVQVVREGGAWRLCSRLTMMR